MNLTSDVAARNELPWFITRDGKRGCIHILVAYPTSSVTVCGRDGSHWPWVFQDTWQMVWDSVEVMCKQCLIAAPAPGYTRAWNDGSGSLFTTEIGDELVSVADLRYLGEYRGPAWRDSGWIDVPENQEEWL